MLQRDHSDVFLMSVGNADRHRIQALNEQNSQAIDLNEVLQHAADSWSERGWFINGHAIPEAWSQPRHDNT
tara:strand:- start:994 stop:1206 length:213 start_codon:yes stop_codon:yes gene_type:complete